MAAMSGIIGGEVVLLGLIALPQMLRLGYNQNLAVGTICASGSLGTMNPAINCSYYLRLKLLRRLLKRYSPHLSCLASC